MKINGVTPFGTTSDGQEVQRIVIAGAELSASILTWGAVLQGVWLEGVPYNLTPGSASLTDYEGSMQYHGSLVAPVINRLSGARAVVDGVERQFEPNQDGRITLHCGGAGTHRKVWRIKDVSAEAVTLVVDLPDGEGGFPGNRVMTARFSVAGAALRMEVTATTDAVTLMNVANHSYWNLDGTPTWAGHQLQIMAEEVLPTDADFVPTGEVLSVAGTAFDFRTARKIMPGQTWLDNSFCLGRERVALREVLVLTGVSGVRMSLATTEPAVQVYDGRAAVRPGHAAHEGLAIEAQNWPDAPNKPGFPSIDLPPGETYRQVTEWRFSA